MYIHVFDGILGVAYSLQALYPIVSDLLWRKEMQKLVVIERTSEVDCPTYYGYTHFLDAMSSINTLQCKEVNLQRLVITE